MPEQTAVSVTINAKEAAQYIGISYWLILDMGGQRNMRYFTAYAGMGRGERPRSCTWLWATNCFR